MGFPPPRGIYTAYAIPEPEVDQASIPEKLRALIGNTPMVEITYTFRGKIRNIYAKCEYFNLTG